MDIFDSTSEYEKLNIKKIISNGEVCTNGNIIFSTRINNGTLIIYEYINALNIYRVSSFYPDSYLVEVKCYNTKNGYISSKSWNIKSSLVNVGKYYQFNDMGKLIKVTNEDDGYRISYLDFIKIINEQVCYIPTTLEKENPKMMEFGKDIINNIPCYVFSYLISDPKQQQIFEIVYVSGMDGNIVKREKESYVD
ncbi:hypothetical protein [Bacteroides uniformis]|uniref:Uncharacterized protein n=1 Tax=Bacteroides uniformis TaxID=820 RepID=A0A374MQI3_BACUN|nr:hypothetical protein [Bacteroides uniformis]RGI73716.1 hypothetical protein DXD90_15060 [Bacteroides uniformis]